MAELVLLPLITARAPSGLVAGEPQEPACRKGLRTAASLGSVTQLGGVPLPPGQEREAGPSPPTPSGAAAENSQLPSWPRCPYIFLVNMFVFSQLYRQRGKSHRTKEEQKEEEKSCVYISGNNLGERATFPAAETTVQPSGAHAESADLLGLLLKHP